MPSLTLNKNATGAYTSVGLVIVWIGGYLQTLLRSGECLLVSYRQKVEPQKANK